jgi:hypothetical protein
MKVVQMDLALVAQKAVCWVVHLVGKMVSKKDCRKVVQMEHRLVELLGLMKVALLA